MANYTTIQAAARDHAGTGAARATRRAGMVPAIIYGAKETPTLIQLEPKLVVKELVRGGWRSRLFEVRVGHPGRPDAAETPVRALIREVQFHPVSDKPIHVDFQRLAPGQRIRVAVAVHFTGELTSPGMKKGGSLNVVRHSVECLADPDSVPETFTADLSALDINDNVRWTDLSGTENVVPVITGRDFVIATITPPTKGAEPTAEAGAAAAPAKGKAAPAKAAPAKAAPAKAAPAKPAAKK